MHTFSIGFDDPAYDERGFAEVVAKRFSTNHTAFTCTPNVEDLKDWIYFLEDPLLTLLNLPLYYLSKEVHQKDFKVVLSGDGADELLGGYRYFGDMKAYQFIKRSPGSPMRPLLLKKLHGELQSTSACKDYFQFLQFQVSKNLAACPFLPYGFYVAQDIQKFLSRQMLSSLTGDTALGFDPAVLEDLSPMDQVFYLETKFRLLNMTLPLSDKMSMAHGVENRSPFLDYEVAEFLNLVPAHQKMQGLKEKFLLKKAATRILPAEITQRKKMPLTAPPGWFLKTMQEPLAHYLDTSLVEDKGYFDPQVVKELQGKEIGTSTDHQRGMILMIFFIHLWDDLFIQQKN